MLFVTMCEGETWRQAVERLASKYGLENECLDEFDSLVASGTEQSLAAWGALYEWDCIEYRGEPCEK